MAEQNDLAITYEEAKRVTTDFFNPAVWTQMKGMAETFRQSGGLPKGLDTVPKIMLVMQAGFEMGMAPVEATQDLYPVNGAVNMWGKALSKRLQKFGYTIEYKNEIYDKDKEETTAVVWKWVKNPSTGKLEKEEHTQRYSYEMAKDSGYTHYNNAVKIGWKYGINRTLKLRYGALNMIIKTSLGKVLGNANGIQEAEEDAVILQTDEQPAGEAAATPAPVKGTASDVKEFLAAAKKNKGTKIQTKKETKIEDAEVVTDEKQPAENQPEGQTTIPEKGAVDEKAKE